MIDLVDRAPAVDVDAAEYARLLGYPPGVVPTGRVAELASWARAWYSVHGRPWIRLRGTERIALDDAREPGRTPGLTIDDVPFTPSRLHALLRESRAHAVVVAAVSAGPELEAEAQRLWHEEKPDEYFFLETYGSAVVEHLAMATGARLCAWAEAQGMAVLPHDSPGYAGWDIAEQPRLLSLAAAGEWPGPLSALDSGALVPKKSLLAVYGVTRQAGVGGRIGSLVPCENCSLARCQYRRRPYRLAAGATGARDRTESDEPRRAALRADAAYRTNRKALQRWARERLVLTPRDDGGVDARFRYDGTTCTNMGRELTFVYDVTVGPARDGYPILGLRCTPAPGDTGHAAMCGFIRQGDALIQAIASERPLEGRMLDDVLSWARPISSAGCYCDQSSREHKWGLVLETIHLALSEQEREPR